MSENKPAGQFPVPGLALVVLLLGVWAISDPPFKPSRPDNPPDLTSAAEDVSARLWQDPMEAVEVHRREKHQPGKENKISRLQSTLADYTFFQDEHHRLCGDPAQSSWNRFIPGVPNQALQRGQTSFVQERSAHTIHELRCQIQRDVTIYPEKPADVHILAVMVPGGPYAEDREARIRSRYAVVTGLSNNGYTPKDAEHIGYMDFAELCRLALQDKMYAQDCDWPATIPYEWFVVDKSAHRTGADNRIANTVLLLWIDEAEMASVKPLHMLKRLHDVLPPGPAEASIASRDRNGKKHSILVRARMDVVGPASSTSLIKMYAEADKGDRASDLRSVFNNDRIRLASPRVTIDELAIRKQLAFPDTKNLGELLKFHRTIVTDEVLVNSLLCELLRRGVNPYPKEQDVADRASSCQGYSSSALNKNNGQDHIVLIGEWDTVYSRNFNDLFSRLISGKEDFDPPWLHRFNYLRGIDGTTSSEKKSSTSSSDNDNRSARKSFRRAIGENQFDYLRRLGDEISSLSEKIENAKGVIRSIGIVGSDTYDKLLILQALRARLPDVIFFTTDLDARMLHQEENEWARNLVVAAGYGLVPDKTEASFEGLPFRDSYQTSMYLTVSDLVNEGQLEKQRCMPVKMFEIGNRFAVDYSQQGQCEALTGQVENVSGSGLADGIGSTRGADDLFGTWHVGTYLGLSALLFLLLIIQTNNQSRKYVLVVAFVVYTLIIWLAIFQPQNSAEFLNMDSGTSIWPAIIIRMLAAVLALMSVFYVLSSLRKNNRRIITTNGLESIFAVNEQFTDRVCDDFRKLNKEEKQQSVMVRIREIARIIFSQLANSFRSSNVLLEGAQIEQGCMKRKSMLSRLCISIWGWDFDKNGTIPLESLFYQYQEMGRTRSWLPRVVSMWGLYIFLTIVFMKSFPSMPFTPFNDGISATASSIVMLVAIPSYLFLIFLVVDVTRLNAQFVDLLSNYSFQWPKHVLSKYCNNYGVNDEVATEKLKIDLIVRRTKAVDVFIFLPFVILFLLIISRSNYFDRWHMPVPLGFIILLGALIALSSAIRLRRTARKARMITLGKLEDIYRKQLYRQSKQEVASSGVAVGRCTHMMPERIRVVMDDIRNINAGPFVPLARHPIVAAIAMPFGGVGGLYLIEYLANVGI